MKNKINYWLPHFLHKMILPINAILTLKNILIGRKRPDLLQKSKFHKGLLSLLHKNYIATNARFTYKDVIFGRKRPNLLHINKIHYQLHHLLHKTKFTTDCLIYFIKIIWSPNARQGAPRGLNSHTQRSPLSYSPHVGLPPCQTAPFYTSPVSKPLGSDFSVTRFTWYLNVLFKQY